MPVLVPAHPRRELRARAAVADRQEATQARADRRRRTPRPAAAGIFSTNRAMREPKSSSPSQAEASYVRMVRDWQATAPEESGRERDTGARIQLGPRRASRAADSKLLTSALRYVSHSRPPTTYRRHATPTTPAASTRAQIPAEPRRSRRPPADRPHRSRSAAPEAPRDQPLARIHPQKIVTSPLTFIRPRNGEPSGRRAGRHVPTGKGVRTGGTPGRSRGDARARESARSRRAASAGITRKGRRARPASRGKAVVAS